MRYAIYFTPPQDASLTRAAVAWLGRDAFEGAAVRSDLAPEVAAATRDARRYGFHATLKAPFRLKEGRGADELEVALERFCRSRAAFVAPPLALTDLSGFLALTPCQASPELDALAGAAVEAFEPFRAGLTADEVAKRRPEALDAQERENLRRWGYPHVFNRFRFHMTLTDRLPDAERERFAAALRERFAGALDAPLAVDGLALFEEPAPGAPFRVRARVPFALTPV